MLFKILERYNKKNVICPQIYTRLLYAYASGSQYKEMTLNIKILNLIQAVEDMVQNFMSFSKREGVA